MARANVIAAMEIAGAENDQQKFLRLYTENRVPFATAKAAYAKGLKIRSRAGLPL